jgi:protein-disulfide isomerase
MTSSHVLARSGGWRALIGGAAILRALVGPGLLECQVTDEVATLQREVQTLKQSQTQMRRELQELRTALRQLNRTAGQGNSAGGATVAIAGSPSLGAPTAPITIVEFSDYQCPFCGQFFAQSFPGIYEHYIETGKVRYVLRDFPLQSHPYAFKAAEAAHCAGDQGRYWRMHDRLFANQQALTPADLTQHARAVGIKLGAFERCLRSGKHAGVVRTSLAGGERLGVTATPTFVIGLTDSASGPGELHAAHVIRGAKPFADFDLVLKALVGELEQSGRSR